MSLVFAVFTRDASTPPRLRRWEDLAAGWTLTHVQIDVRANVPDASQANFMDAALKAKTNCPIARLLKTNISMTTRLDP